MTEKDNKKEEEPAQTEWVVITGGPSSGKTTIINALKTLNYPIVQEAARQIEEEELSLGKTREEIRKDEVEFSRKVFERKVTNEEQLSPNVLRFLDRGIPDTIAYLLDEGKNFLYTDVLNAVKASRIRKYKAVFLLEQLPGFEKKDRPEDARKGQELSGLIHQSYELLGYPVTKVPVFSSEKDTSIRERLKFILGHLGLTQINPEKMKGETL